MNDQLCMEAVMFFRSAPVYDRLLRAVKKRFLQLGRMGGTITLTKLTELDQEALSAFFGRNFLKQQQVRIALAEFVKALQVTRFARISPEELLEKYFDESLVTDAEQAEEWQKDWKDFFDALLAEYCDECCQLWLTELLNRRGSGYRLVLKKFTGSRERLREELTIVCRALVNLPERAGRWVRLPIFASELTRDPHGFDGWTDTGKLLQAALVTVYMTAPPENGEQSALLYKRAGIIKGDISSYVTTFGLLAYQDSGPHPLWQGAVETGEVLQLTLDNLLRVERVMAPGGTVYVVENPAVFSELVEACGDAKAALICSNGQPRLAVWLLLDLLVAGGTKICYSGDFDPEGLGIAQRMADRYPEHVSMWHYTVDDYLLVLSDLELNERRLNKLAGITCRELTAVRDLILQEKRAGYQERLVGRLVKDLGRG